MDLLSVGESVMLLCRLGGFPGEGLHPEKLMKSEGLLEPPLARRFRLGSRSGNEGAEWRERQAEECAQSQKPEGELNRNRAWSSRRKEEHSRKVLRSSSSPPIQAFIHSFIHQLILIPRNEWLLPVSERCLYQLIPFSYNETTLNIRVCLGLCKHRFPYSLITALPTTISEG